ncbi:MAG TPA: LuxR C-terminal-related transcriptional regulator [Gaiellaceae bacterium]|nr:LuxR C-terminal-related transcriptional regulator [Gaiellaceae bacterium]
MDVPFDLVEAKLSAPFVRPGTVAKADVITRLCTERAPFVSLVAPAGYGKTTLLARWADADQRPFAWVSLDGRHDDALVFLRYIAAALHRVEPLPRVVFSALSGPRGSASATRVLGVGRTLAARERPLVLVLDDLHAVENPSCLDVLAELVQFIPAGSQIAAASREEPALPLARWRAQGQTEEIGVADLRLNEQEAELLLAAAGVELAPSELSELTERTEGWPAGLYLAALSMRAGGEDATSVGAFTGDDRFVAEYFRVELLDRLPAAEASFLEHTSVLDRMCGGLCDAVLQTTSSAHTLESLERTNGFVVPLDRRGEWYRYHHLFRQLLRTELERREPQVVRELSARAMAWCIANELIEEAIVYGHAAGETDTVAQLLDALALPLYFDGRLETLEEWLAWFDDDDELARYPALAVYAAWVHVLTGRPADCERFLALADGATSAIPLSDGSATIEPWVATLRAAMMGDGVEQALADANLALEQFPPESTWTAVALLIRGVALALLDEADQARAGLATTVERSLSVGSVESAYVGHAELALLAARRGAWGEAGRHARAAHALVEETGLGEYAPSAIVHAASARVALHEGRQEDARAALARAHRLRPQLDHGIPWLTVQVGLELTRAHLALAEAGPARTVLSETERVLELRPDLGSLVAEARELHERVAATAGSGGAWAMSLTRAELRLLPYLATHLTIPEIASRLFISRNTAKTEAVSIYRKLGASSRSQAIERAVGVGLLESSLYPSPANLIQEV